MQSKNTVLNRDLNIRVFGRNGHLKDLTKMGYSELRNTIPMHSLIHIKELVDTFILQKWLRIADFKLKFLMR